VLDLCGDHLKSGQETFRDCLCSYDDLLGAGKVIYPVPEVIDERELLPIDVAFNQATMKMMRNRVVA
jgi:hypothetical protein